MLKLLLSICNALPKDLPIFGQQKPKVLNSFSMIKIMPRNISRVLNVAEKNDAAKRISELLSDRRSTWRDGFSKYNKIYEFNFNLFGANCQMIMTSLSGHLLTYEFSGSYRKWYSCHPSSLFSAEVKKEVTENMINIKKTLEKEIRSCQVLVIWTDCDREGENIGYEIINVCRNIKPNVTVYRARFSEITDRSVRSACQNLLPPDQNVSDAVDVRQELDLRIGAAFTRFQTLRLQKVFPEVLADKLISYGSCQFPTLGFVVERYKAREQFQSEQFWKIEVDHTTTRDNDDPITSSFSWKRHRLFDELACQILHDKCIETPVIATVTDVTSRPRSRWRPVALETVELEKLASRKLRINAKETMRIAEKLYTQGFISYPRTETNMFPKDIELRKLVEEQTHHHIWGAFAQGLLQLEGGPTPRNGRKTDKAHPPIHPTKFTNSLSGDEARIYEMIVRHFLACCHRDAQGHETTVEIELGGEKFSAQGLMIIEKNYLKIYIYDKWNAKIIPVYRVGEEFAPTDVRMTQGGTTAPPLLTEADLIALMDKHGIGTDATHAEHIETIKQRRYVGLTHDQRFLPGELGMGLVEGYNLMGYEMSRPELRAELEADLRKICEGRANKTEVLQRHIEKYRSVFMEAMTKASKFMVSCIGFPSCTTAAFLPSSVLSITVDNSICPCCRPAPVHRVKIKLKRSDVPAYMDPEQITCICGCDEDITNMLGIRFRSNASTYNVSSRQNQRAPLHPVNNNTTNRSPGYLGNSRNNSVSRPQHGAGYKRTTAGKRKHPSNATGTANYRNSVLEGTENSGTDDTPKCNCGQEAVQLTVRKEGPNTGRKFFKCSQTSGGCSFFVWADAPTCKRSSNTSETQEQGNRSHRQRAQSAPRVGVTVKCQCGLDAVDKTVQKDGPNKGRVFYTCPKPRADQCGFFEWAEQGLTKWRPLVDGPTNVAPAPSRPRATRKPPTCSICKQLGHTRRTCPNR